MRKVGVSLTWGRCPEPPIRPTGRPDCCARQSLSRYVGAEMKQRQFLDVASVEEARTRWLAGLELRPGPPEALPLDAALGRILAEDVRAPGDVPAFDRAHVDGYAVRAADTFGASEGEPATLHRLDGSVAAAHCVDESQFRVFGQEINGNHLRPNYEGWVTGTCRPFHIGRTSHVWGIEIRNEAGKLTCISRITMAVVPIER